MNDLDMMLSDARDEVDAAVEGLTPPPFRSSNPTAGRRLAVAVATAAVLLTVIGGSTWWVRNQGNDANVAVTDATTESTAHVATDSSLVVDGAGEAEARAIAELEERLRTVSLDLRTIVSAPNEIDVQALSSRYDSIAALAETAADELQTRAAQLADRLAAVARMAGEVDAALNDLTAKRDMMAVQLQSLRTAGDVATLAAEVDAAEAQIDALRLMRDELAALASELESEMSAIYVAIAPNDPEDGLTVTAHDFGLRDRGLGASFVGVASHGADLWAITSLVVSPDEQREYGLVMRIGGASPIIEDTVELEQPMQYISAGDTVIWLARAGDGALPESSVATVDPASLEVEMADLDRLAVTAIAGDDEGLWLASSWPAQVSYFDRTARQLTKSFELGGDGPVTSIALATEPSPVLWAGMADGRVVRIDAATGSELSVTELGDMVTDLAVTGAIDPRGAAPVWVTTIRGAHLLDGGGTLVDTHTLGDAACCALPQSGISDSAWILTQSGELRHVYPGTNELVVAVEAPTDDPDEGRGPRAMTAAGPSIWIVQGPWLTEVRFPQ